MPACATVGATAAIKDLQSLLDFHIAVEEF